MNLAALFICVGMGCMFGLAAHAQGYGTVVGTVTDSTGAAVPSASVIATAVQTGVHTKAVTNGQGSFTFPTLLPTQYAITVSVLGFEKYTQTSLVLGANQSLTVNVHLKFGAANENGDGLQRAPAGRYQLWNSFAGN